MDSVNRSSTRNNKRGFDLFQKCYYLRTQSYYRKLTLSATFFVLVFTACIKITSLGRDSFCIRVMKYIKVLLNLNLVIVWKVDVGHCIETNFCAGHKICKVFSCGRKTNFQIVEDTKHIRKTRI